MLPSDTEKNPVTAAEVNVPGQVSAPKYAHPGSFKPVPAGIGSEEQDSQVPDAEFTDVVNNTSETGAKKARRRRRKKGKRR